MGELNRHRHSKNLFSTLCDLEVVCHRMSRLSIINLVEFFDNATASVLVTVFPMVWLKAVYFLVFWSLFRELRAAERVVLQRRLETTETMTESSGAMVIPAGQNCFQYERHFGIVSSLSINHSDSSITALCIYHFWWIDNPWYARCRYHCL